jgi:hypothetical protein
MSYQLPKPFTHSQIIIATITKAESHSTRSDLLAVEVEITRECLSQALLFAAAGASRMARESVSVGSCGRWTAEAVAAARRIDNRADAAH